MAVQQKTGDRFGVVQTWNAMGVAWNHMDRPDKSLECYRNGLQEARALGDQSAVQFMEGAVATALLRSGKPAEAIPIFEGFLARNPEPYIARFRLAALADAYLAVGRPADALATVDKALALDHTSQPDALATIPVHSAPEPTQRWAGRTTRLPTRARRWRRTSASGSRCCRWTSSSAGTAT